MRSARRIGEILWAAAISGMIPSMNLRRPFILARQATRLLPSTADMPAVPKPCGSNAMKKNAKTNERPDDHSQADDHIVDVSGQSIAGDGAGDQLLADDHIAAVPATIAAIQELHMRREAAVRQRNRLDNACRAFARRLLGFQTMLPEPEREAIRKKAEELVSAMMDGTALPAVLPAVAKALLPMVDATRIGRRPFDEIGKACAKEMEKLAKQLPAAAFVESVRGFGFVGFAQIIGETGDLRKYANPAKVWKRMGLAVAPDGKAQRRITGDAAIEMGFSPQRRKISWVIGDSLIKGNKDGYRSLYDERKEMEKARNPEMTKGHAHKRAQRFMEKRLLRELWRAWRDDGKANQLVETMG